ncbi:cytosolic protein [Vibrio aestuarianus subsp. cardii]|uniref:cytosolic protein n=1 Tax=Vibrio aestuarianus TaxID=28171 RepID=UPI001592DB2F|nr:cytosolic protein [Vibrio aestuarianus]NGZ94075.1 cytosolic protein [Vibrio aestuarianus subsp. cardii]
MFIHHVNGIDWLVITAFEELKTMFIKEAGVITDTGAFQRQDNEEDLNPQLACLVEGHGRVFIYHGGFVAFVDDEQTFITRMN